MVSVRGPAGATRKERAAVAVAALLALTGHLLAVLEEGYRA